MIEIKQTLESLSIETTDGALFNELQSMLRKNFAKTLGQKDKVISFYDENENAQRKYFFKFLAKICEKHGVKAPDLFLCQYATIKIIYKQINSLKVVIFCEVIFADGCATFNFNAPNGLFASYIAQKFKDQKILINDDRSSLCIHLKDPKQTAWLEELLNKNEHMHFSVFFNYDKNDLNKFKRDLNVKNSQKFVRRFSTLAELFEEQFQALNCLSSDCFETVRTNYLELVKLYHPDRHASKSEKIKLEYRNKFEKIQNAYESLKNYFKEQEAFVNAV